MTIHDAAPPEADGAAATHSIRFIGTATVLIRYGGLTVLTDPNFIHAGEEIPIGFGLTTTRLTDPAMEFDDLPPLDAVILSHYHADHFDRIAEERLDRSLPIVTTPQAATRLEELAFTNAQPLETWSSATFSNSGTDLRVTSMPGRHAPSPVTVAMPDVMGSFLEFSSRATVDGATHVGGRELRLYITGDTIVYEGLREIPQRHPEIDIALIHLGGTRVMGVTVTMDAEQGVELLRTVRPTTGVPIHYDDYEAFRSPLEEFVSAVRGAGLEDQVRYLARGETLDLTTPVAA